MLTTVSGCADQGAEAGGHRELHATTLAQVPPLASDEATGPSRASGPLLPVEFVM